MGPTEYYSVLIYYLYIVYCILNGIIIYDILIILYVTY